MQVQVESRAYTFEVVYALSLKFVATSSRSFPEAEVHAMFAYLRYQTSKRNNISQNSSRYNSGKRTERF